MSDMHENNEYTWYSDGCHAITTLTAIFDEKLLYSRQKGMHEKGGIVLGTMYEKHDEIIKLAGPHKRDKSGLFSFIRRKEPAQRIIDKAWNRSGGHVVYLGEWHVHPGCNPIPSTRDRKMIRKAFLTTQMEIDHIYMIIFGGDRSCWIGRQDNDGLHQLSILNQGI